MDSISRLEVHQYTKNEYVEEELNKTDSSDECDTEDEECVDILSTSPSGQHKCLSPGPEDSDHSRIDEEPTHNNFSIDRILGIQKDRKKEDGKCDKEDKYLQPNPLPIIPRASK